MDSVDFVALAGKDQHTGTEKTKHCFDSVWNCIRSEEISWIGVLFCVNILTAGSLHKVRNAHILNSLRSMHPVCEIHNIGKFSKTNKHTAVATQAAFRHALNSWDSPEFLLRAYICECIVLSESLWSFSFSCCLGHVWKKNLWRKLRPNYQEFLWRFGLKQLLKSVCLATSNSWQGTKK